LDASYPNALDVGGQLALGTLLLEGTEKAITPQQAAALLPLWQAVQEVVKQGSTQVDGILEQLAGTMTRPQLETIAAKQLAQEDLGAWVQSQRTSRAPGGGRGQKRTGSASVRELTILVDPLIELLTLRATE
jgi:hypothetical protein